METKDILGNDPFLKEEEENPRPALEKDPPLRLINPLPQTETPAPLSRGNNLHPAPGKSSPVPLPPRETAKPRITAPVRMEGLDRVLDTRLREIEEHILSSFHLLEQGMEEIMECISSPGKEMDQIQIGLRGAADSYNRRFESVIEKIETSLPHPQNRKNLLSRINTPLHLGQTLFKPRMHRNLWRRFSMRGTGEEVDEFGYDAVYEDRMKSIFDFLYKKWWRIEAEGVTNIPDSGRALLVSNHSGAIPFDALMIKLAIRYNHPARREARPLVENFSYYFPFIGNFLARTGSIRACQENAQRLLEKDEAIVVFPEGNKGPTKLFRERYRLQRFGRGGFVRLAIKTRSPIVPIAVIGAEEIYPVFARADFIGKRLGLPIFFITPTFPWFGPLGAIPLPSKWYIRVGEAIRCDEYPPESAEDEILVNQLSEKIRALIQEMIYDTLKKRKSVWKG